VWTGRCHAIKALVLLCCLLAPAWLLGCLSACPVAGMMSAWVQAMRVDGPLSCYQGFGVAVLSMAAYKALYFGLYDTAKMVLLPQVRMRVGR